MAWDMSKRDSNRTYGQRWTEGELETLRNLYPSGADWDEMLDEIPGRDRGSIAHRAHYEGLTRPVALDEPPTESPSVQDIAWAAGFWEGEGSIQVMDRGAVYVRLGQKELQPLQWLRNKFGGAIYERKNGVHLWTIADARARGFIMTIYKFLSDRRKAQVKPALEANVD